jgi:hypothetical protein
MGAFMRRIFFCVFLLTIFTGGIFAQQVLNLDDALNRKQVSVSIAGNGSSSGASLEGTIQNLTGSTLQINTVIRGGVYFINSGVGQNMAAVAVYLGGGEYYSDGTNTFIQVAARATTPVILIAFCADFDKDNPNSGESFSTAAMPTEISSVIAKISRYMADHPDDDTMAAAQIALWMAEGETAASIRNKFDFTAHDEELAKIIAAY